eukprot:TRINITY_DN21020_c0_g1_i1.p1 TRINITY_DN21020_c0_g1~~TRINITY_DN21020_c0_g1_i1.p1  ORF type:complete len:509 (+),score=63.28 TRINITY_DN21020_c0_g1_i1:23-1528(+)
MGRTRPTQEATWEGTNLEVKDVSPTKRSVVKPKLAPLALSKAQSNLELAAAELEPRASCAVPRRAAILVVPGAFCPVQQVHLDLLERAAQGLRMRRGLPVVAGFLAPVPDSEVDEALGPDRLCLQIRSNLCGLAVQDSHWLEVCPWGWSNPTRIAGRICKAVSDRLAWVGGLCWEFEAWWLVWDLPQLKQHLSCCTVPAVCLCRHDGSSRAIAQAPTTGAKNISPHLARQRRFAAEPAAVLIYHRHSQEEVPSSQLMALVTAGSWDELSERQCVHPQVLESLRAQRFEGSVLAPSMDADLLPGPGLASQLFEQELIAESSRPKQPITRKPIACKSDFEELADEPKRLRFVNGDASKVGYGRGQKILAHMCNDQGNGGRGFFQAIKREWGQEPSRAYFEWHRDRTAGGPDAFCLGAVQFTRVSPLVEVASIIGLQGHKSGSKGPPVRYSAIEEALRSVGQRASERNASIHIPFSGGGPDDTDVAKHCQISRCGHLCVQMKCL